MPTNATGSGQSDLKLEPHMIPKLREAFQSALEQLRPLSQGGQGGFRMTSPAMADAASKDFQVAFNTATSDGPESAAAALTDYRQRLEGVLKQLGEIERAYANNEHQTAAELSRQLGS